MADKEVKILVSTDVDDDEVEALEDLLESLEGKGIGFEVEVEDGELDSAKAKEEELNTTAEVEIEVDDSAVQLGIQNIKDGFSSIKQSAAEIGQVMGDALESAGKQETNKAFLEQAVGNADLAKQKLQEINGVVQDLPGDDSVLQGLLGQAVAKDASLTTEELSKMGGAAADYFAAMQNYGKSSTEAFQDMNNYLMTGNTAEIERSPILANHIDKLKEATTIQERSQLLQEALNEEHWGGISAQDTYNNKLETFNGMLERGQYNLGGMFQEGAKGAMDFVLQLDSATNGWVGMGLAAAQFASPLTDAVFGLGQMATGMKAIKDLGMIQYLKDLEIMTKLSAAADWLLSGAQAVLNAIMSLNPIVLVVIALVALAAALIWAYQNVDWFREMVDNAWASLQQFGQELVTNIQNAINQFVSAVQGIPNALKQCLDWAHDIVMNHPIVQALIWLGNKAAEAFAVLGLGQSSPGKIVQAMENELDWTSEAIKDSDLAKDTAKLGNSMSNTFNPSFSNGSTNTGGNITLHVEVGSVDNSDRVQEIVEAVRRELAWNNTTAGRSV